MPGHAINHRQGLPRSGCNQKKIPKKNSYTSPSDQREQNHHGNYKQHKNSKQKKLAPLKHHPTKAKEGA
jgi:hypothetical protein